MFGAVTGLVGRGLQSDRPAQCPRPPLDYPYPFVLDARISGAREFSTDGSNDISRSDRTFSDHTRIPTTTMEGGPDKFRAPALAYVGKELEEVARVARLTDLYL